VELYKICLVDIGCVREVDCAGHEDETLDIPAWGGVVRRGLVSLSTLTEAEDFKSCGEFRERVSNRSRLCVFLFFDRRADNNHLWLIERSVVPGRGRAGRTVSDRTRNENYGSSDGFVLRAVVPLF
jgi:hypothetical protein